MTTRYLVEVVSDSAADASALAEELRTTLLQSAPGASVERQSINKGQLDVGAILAVIVARDATLEIAKGIAKGVEAFLGRNRGITIRITTSDGHTAEIENLSRRTFKDLMKHFC